MNLCSPSNNETYQERLLRLEGDKESLVLQVGTLRGVFARGVFVSLMWLETAKPDVYFQCHPRVVFKHVLFLQYKEGFYTNERMHPVAW